MFDDIICIIYYFARYENPGVMRRSQLDQIRQVTLAR